MDNPEYNIKLLMVQIVKQKISLLFFIGFFSAFGAFNTVAQDIKHIIDSDTIQPVNTIQAIPQSNIGIETEATLKKLREISDAIQPTVPELIIDSLINEKMEIFDQLKKGTDIDKISEMNPLEIESIKNNFLPMRELFNNWRNTYMDKTNQIVLMKRELEDVKTAWEKTLSLDINAALPRLVMERIKMNLDQVDEIENQLTKRNNALLTKEDKITVVLIYIDDVLSSIAKTENSLRSEIFSVNSPPIWQLLNVKDSGWGLKKQVSEIIASHYNDLKIFITNYKNQLYFHFFFFVILFFLLVYLRHDVAKWSDEKKDEAISSSLYIISKPFSSSLIVTLAVTGLFYSEAPKDVLSIYYIFLTFPILYLVPGLINGVDRKYFYVIGAIFILSEFGDYFNELVIIDRFNLLFLNTITGLLLITVLRNRKKIKTDNPKVKWEFTFALLRMCLFLLSVSILSNIIGGTVLPKVLTRGTMVMVFGGSILYSCYIILKGLFALLLQYDKISGLSMIRNYADEVKRSTFNIIKWLIIIYWLYITLSGYLIYEPIYSMIEGVLSNEWKVGSIVISLGSILAFFITLWISLLISKFIRFILQDEILTHFELPRGVPGAISMLVRLTLICIGFILAFGAAKINMSNIAIVFGALGVGIGFGLQNIFNNLVSGLILAFERPIQVGDIIEISNTKLQGQVKDIGIRASVVRTFDGAEVIVPNGNLISNEMINWTLSDHQRRQEIIVGVAYGSDMQRVLEILNTTVQQNKNVMKVPNPLIVFSGFGDSSLNFRLLFWTHFENGLGTKSEVGIAVNNALNEAGIEIPFPQRDLNLRTVSDEINFAGMLKDKVKSAPLKSKAAKQESVPDSKKQKTGKNSD